MNPCLCSKPYRRGKIMDVMIFSIEIRTNIFKNTYEGTTILCLSIYICTFVIVYVCGGEEGTLLLANGEVYDPQEDVWTEMNASMSTPRCEFGMCAHDGFLYAFGGWVGEDIGGSIERYNSVTDR